MKKEVREGYKKTLAGYIPDEWGYEELNKLVNKITDGTHKTPNYTDDGIPFLRVTDIQQSNIDWGNVKYISKEEHLELIKRCNPELGDILYSKNGTIGIPKIIDWNKEFSIFVSLCLIKMKKENSLIINKYLEQFLKSDSCMRQIRLRAKQGTVTNLHLEEIRELVVPIPTKEEQEKIASILSTVDEQIDNTEKLIQKNQELKKGLMQQLLTKGIGHTKFKKTEIGEIPEGWEIIELINLSKKIGDGLHGTPVYNENGEYYFINGNNLVNGKIIFADETKMVDKKEYEKYKKKLNENTILISLNGTIGNLAFYNFEKIVLGKSSGYITLKDNISKNYVFYILNSERVKQYFIKELTGSTIKNLSLNTLRKTKFPIPSLLEQEKIALILSSVDEKIEQYQNKKEKLEVLKKGLMQKLLTGEIRVI